MRIFISISLYCCSNTRTPCKYHHCPNSNMWNIKVKKMNII